MDITFQYLLSITQKKWLFRLKKRYFMKNCMLYSHEMFWKDGMLYNLSPYYMPEGMRARGSGGLVQPPPPPQGPIYLACHGLARHSWFGSQRLCSRVQWFFKLTMLNVVLDWQKISKTILEKALFFILWCFYLFSIFVLINFKIGSSERWNFFLEIGQGIKKSRILNWFQKSKLVLVSKCPPKNLKLKNCFLNLLSPIFFRFLILTFFGGILSLR